MIKQTQLQHHVINFALVFNDCFVRKIASQQISHNEASLTIKSIRIMYLTTMVTSFDNGGNKSGDLSSKGLEEGIIMIYGTQNLSNIKIEELFHILYAVDHGSLSLH